ncbi:MAG: fasciclin domain-containing protein [Bacteroidales bacterium]|nr:fasciclin domain-containing protein [Bacteroidales bacterium]MCF8392155.1 fasciclin domain-containing protein [Bacteroidales bacterium]
MNKYFLYFIFLLIFSSCQKDLEDLEKYKAPSWLKGKLYSQVEDQENLKIFTECLSLTGIDTIINTSGLYTVFAPSDEAFALYFSDHPEYSNDVKNIPLEELENLVEFHIIQNSWSKVQLRKINLDGWIDEEENVEHRANKKETLYKQKNLKYNVNYSVEEGFKITNNEAALSLTAFTRSRKYVPVFFSEYFTTYGIPESDYQYYFNRPFNGGIYYAKAKVFDEFEIPAENGYLYIIDRVIEPLLNAEELMGKEYPDYSYTDFLDLIHEFPFFELNLDETNKQVGAADGLQVDSLYNLTYPDLAFNIQSEITGPNENTAINSIQYHNSIFVPTNQAFNAFMDTYINGSKQWGSLKNVPPSVKTIILNSHMVKDISFQSDIVAGFINEERDEVLLPENIIVQKEFGSNSVYIGLSEAIVPRAFSSVSAPVYLRRGYYTLLNAIEETNILAALKKRDADYSFFVIPDLYSGMLSDSSLFITLKNNRIDFKAFNQSTKKIESISKTDLRKKLLNHVGVERPVGAANIEFVKNLAGNYIVFDNVNNYVSGTSNTTYGYNGDSVINIQPKQLEEITDNGNTYQIDTWFSFANVKMSNRIREVNNAFLLLMAKAGLAVKLLGDEYELNFINQGTFYTAFIPSPAALSAYNTDTLTNTELQEFIKAHFIAGEIIFTDGKAPSGSYSTLNQSNYKNINIETGYDYIRILDDNNTEYTTINIDPLKTNLTTTTAVSNDEVSSNWSFVTTGVIHLSDKVLIK